MATQVRTIDASEFGDWVASMDVGFLRTRDDREEFARYYLGEVDLERTWGAMDSDQVVGTLRSFPTPLTVPGPGFVTAAALTNVTVAPTHRRRGLLSQMILGDLTASAEREEPVGILIASEYPIYGRFGYGAAAEAAGYTVDARSARFRSRGVGSVELVDLATLRKEAPSVYETYRASQPGAIGRDERWWDRRLHQVEVPGEGPPKGYTVLYRSASGEVEGYLRYTASDKWDDMRPHGTLHVNELVSVTRAAYQRLWQYCCEVDLISTVNASDRSVDEMLPWLLVDARVIRQSMRFDFLWVRILDVCATLSARRYLAEGRVVIEVVDPLGFASGRYALEVGPDGSDCRRTTEEAELVLPVDVLGSIYLGGMSLRLVAGDGRVDELRHGSLAKADVIFRSDIAPWCATWF